MSALTRLLATEDAAVYLFGVLGARASAPRLVAELGAAYTEHVATRDALAQLLRDQGVTPPGPAVAYAVPAGWHGDAALRRAAIGLQQRCTAAYVAAVGQVGGSDRRWVADRAGASAVREVLLGAKPAVLPGLRPRR